MNYSRKVIVSIAAVFFLCSLLITACNGPTTTPTTQPTPPLDRSELPLMGHLWCGGGGSYLWEFPGIEPEPDDSNVFGDRGIKVGTLEPCSSVLITRLRWSSWDRAYYVFVDSESARGWLNADMVVIESRK